MLARLRRLVTNHPERTTGSESWLPEVWWQSVDEARPPITQAGRVRGEGISWQQRWRGLGGSKVVTDFDDRVVPRHLYVRDVIVGGLTRRCAGETWERAAAT